MRSSEILKRTLRDKIIKLKTKHVVSLGNAISIYQIRPLGELYGK